MTRRRRHDDHCCCPDCARRAAGARRAAELARAAIGAAPDDLGARVLARVHAEGAAPREAARRPRGAGRVAARLPRIAAAGAVLLALAVWGPSLEPSGGPDAVAAVPVGPLPTDCPAAEHGPRPLEVAGVWSGAEAAGFARVLRRFERETGVPVVFHYETRDIAAKLRARMARGCPPDVALLPQPGLMSAFAREGAIRPLGRAAAELVRAGYSPTWRHLGTVDGRLFGVWFKASDKSMLWYRPAALRAAGVDVPPASWRELVATARRLSRAGIQPLAVAGADGWTLTDWFENVYLRDAGARRYDALARGELPWTDPSVRRALRRLASLLGDPSTVGDSDDLLATTFEESVRRTVGPNPTAAMVYEGDFVRSFAAEPPAPAPAFADFPAIGGRGGSVVGGDVAVRFARSARAARLIRFLATPRAAATWARVGGFVSPNRSVPAAAYADPLSRAVAAKLTGARVVRFDLSDLQPPAFGATDGQGMWRLFRVLAARPDAVDEVARGLESAAAAAR